MKRLLKTLILSIGLFSLVSCEDLFYTNPNDITNSEDYIAVDDEMYKGYLGLLAKMQQAGDHSILLTDTRGDYLEVTGRAPLALQQIYEYAPTQGNSYADPTCYYSIIFSCNDYIEKMRVYRNKSGNDFEEVAEENFKKLISSTLRLKVWAYLTIGRIYGKAIWFDDPLETIKDINDPSVFTLCDMPMLVDKCIQLLDNGIVLYKGENIPSYLEMEWGTWFNPESPTEDYDHWKYVVPSSLLLRCDLLSWRGNQADYQTIKDSILNVMYKKHNELNLENAGWYYACNIPLMTGGDNKYNCEYYKMFFVEYYNASSKANLYQLLSGIMYDYKNQQRNRIVEYFCPQSPGKYYLKPSSFAIGKYTENDTRSFRQKFNMNIIAGDTCFTKYYYQQGKYLRTKIVEIHPALPLYRGQDLHFWLAEAENHLGNWEVAEVILNNGITNKFAKKELPKGWDPRYMSWFCENGGYGDNGIVGSVRGKVYQLPTPKDTGYNLTEEERKKIYDLALLDEALLEFCGEGKSYSMMIRMAEKYNDPQIISDRVCPKYPAGQRENVKASILSGGYWVNWNLNINEVTQ